MEQDPFATYNPAPLSNLTKTLTQVHFPTYFSTFTPRSYPDRVIITHPPYAIYLSKLLEETPSDVIEAYLVIRAALALSPYLGLTTEAWQAQRSLMESLTGIKKGAVGDRSEYCIGQVENALGFAAGRFFVNETFAGDSRKKGTKVITGQASACNTFCNHFQIFLPSWQTLWKVSKSLLSILTGWMRNLQSPLLRRYAISGIIRPLDRLFCRPMQFALK